MSFVNVVVVKNRKIKIFREHFRKAINALEQNIQPTLFVDGGYLIIDFDSKIILDCQDCFSLTDIKKGELKNKLKEMSIYFCPK
jgi:hypothetical protein